MSPVDRFKRSADECRADAELAAALQVDLAALEERSRELLLGRQVGNRFWRRYTVQLASLQHLVDRDQRWARQLDEAAAEYEAWKAEHS